MFCSFFWAKGDLLWTMENIKVYYTSVQKKKQSQKSAKSLKASCTVYDHQKMHVSEVKRGNSLEGN